MTQDTQPEVLRLADALEKEYGSELLDDAADELRRQHARIAELEAELAAVKAAPAPAGVASKYAHRELYFAAYALCDGVCEDHPEINNVFSIGTHGRLCNALAGLDDHYDVPSPDERISKDQLPPAAPQAQDLQDALRWQIVHDHVCGDYIAGRACFVVSIPPLPGTNIMRGSVAEHFTKAVDGIAAQAKQGGSA